MACSYYKHDAGVSKGMSGAIVLGASELLELSSVRLWQLALKLQ